MFEALFFYKNMKIFIDWNSIQSLDDYLDIFLPKVEAPDWHGRNLDALNDSVVTGSINKIEPPYCIINMNSENLSHEAQNLFDAINGIYSDANKSGRKIRVFSE